MLINLHKVYNSHLSLSSFAIYSKMPPKNLTTAYDTNPKCHCYEQS
jgi:hypothetical protein